ncbi:MAG: hypothetical protein IKS83_06865 [Victivallales bacterium]|nr:hypothetical protein [Victivallales bacterium]
MQKYPRILWWYLGLLVVGFALYATMPNFQPGGDGGERLKFLTNLEIFRTVIPCKHSALMPLSASAALWLDLCYNGMWFVLRHNLFLLALGLWAAWKLLRRLGWSIPATGNFCLLVMCGGLFGDAIRHFYGENFTALLVAIGSLWLACGSVWGNFCLVIGVANIPATILAYGLILLRRIWEKRSWRPMLWLLPLNALLVGDHLLRYGFTLSTGYEGDAGYKTFMPYSGLPGFSYPFFLGVLGILFSFGKGMLFFFPALALWLEPRWRGKGTSHELLNCWLLFVAGLILVYAKWWSWYGGWSFGPRFFLFAGLPAVLLMINAIREAPRNSCRQNLLLLFIVFWQCYVGFCAVHYGMEGIFFLLENNYAYEAFNHYIPEFTVLFNAWRPFPHGYRAWSLAIFHLLVAITVTAPIFPILFRQLRQSLHRDARTPESPHHAS